MTENGSKEQVELNARLLHDGPPIRVARLTDVHGLPDPMQEVDNGARSREVKGTAHRDVAGLKNLAVGRLHGVHTQHEHGPRYGLDPCQFVEGIGRSSDALLDAMV